MSIMKFKTTNPHLHGVTRILPLVGEVTFSIEGEIDVEISNDEVDSFLNDVPHLRLADESGIESKFDFTPEQLNTLTEDEVAVILSDFPKSKVKNLTTLEAKKEFLKKNMPSSTKGK